MCTVNSSGSRVTIEGDIPLSDQTWSPRVGETFYSSNILSLKEPVIEYVWRASDSDYFLRANNLVYQTPDGAMERYRHILMVMSALDHCE